MLELGKFSKNRHTEIGKYLKMFIQSTFWCKYFENINIFSKDFKNVLMENSIIMFKASNGVGLNNFLTKKIYKC